MPKDGRRIAVACDNSEHSEQALRWCITEVYRPNDVLILIHVATPLDKEPLADDTMSRSRSTPSPRRRRPNAEDLPCIHASWQVLERLKAVCEEYQAAYIAVLSRGDVQLSFTEVAKAQDCDLALIWSRCCRGSALQRARASFDHAGSITNFSLQRLPCPIIMYRRGERESQRDVRPRVAPHLHGAKARSLSQSPSPASKRTSSQRHMPRVPRRAASASPAPRAGDETASENRSRSPQDSGSGCRAILRTGAGRSKGRRAETANAARSEGGNDSEMGGSGVESRLSSSDECHSTADGAHVEDTAGVSLEAKEEAGRERSCQDGHVGAVGIDADGGAGTGGFQSPSREVEGRKAPPPPVDVTSPRCGSAKPGARGGRHPPEAAPGDGHDDNPPTLDKGGGARRGWNPDLPETPVALNAPTPAYCSRRRIGVGVDGSEGAKAALRWVVRNYYRSF